MRTLAILLATMGITASADLKGVSIHGDPRLTCSVNGSPASAMFSTWDELGMEVPRVGNEFQVFCWYPETLGFYHTSVIVEGFAVFVPMIGK